MDEELARVIEDELDEWGLSIWFDDTDFEPIDLARRIVTVMQEQGWKIERMARPADQTASVRDEV